MHLKTLIGKVELETVAISYKTIYRPSGPFKTKTLNYCITMIRKPSSNRQINKISASSPLIIHFKDRYPVAVYKES